MWLPMMAPADASLVLLCCSWNRSRGTTNPGVSNVARPAKLVAPCAAGADMLWIVVDSDQDPRGAVYACERSSDIDSEGGV